MRDIYLVVERPTKLRAKRERIERVVEFLASDRRDLFFVDGSPPFSEPVRAVPEQRPSTDETADH